MKRTRVPNLLISLLFITSFVLGSVVPVSAQSAPVANVNPKAAANTTPAQPSSAPAMSMDEMGGMSGMGQMRTTTQAMRNAVALNQKQTQKAVTQNIAGIDPATQKLSPLGVVADGITTLANGIAKMAAPLSAPDYFGIANWTNSPLPTVGTNGALSGGIRKFIDSLPMLGNPTASPVKNDLGQYIPLGVADTTTFPGNTANNPNIVASDYYEVGLVEYYEQMHIDLPGPKNPSGGLGTKLRGYVQLYPLGTAAQPAPSAVQLTTANGLSQNIIDPTTNQPRWAYDRPQYLGPTILAQKNRPVRVKFTNLLPTGPAGDLFIPVDTTYMGAGMGPNMAVAKINVVNGGAGYTTAPIVSFNNTGTGGSGGAAVANISNGKVVSITVTNGGSMYASAPKLTLTGGGATTAATATAVISSPSMTEMYKQNRATLHLHGGNTPWISDGTPHQWTTPAGEVTSYSKGDSVSYVPDMWFDATGKLIPSCAEKLTCAVAGATNDPGAGSLTFYWTNQQSGRLLFYHDHSYGITRLNVYAGEAAGYLITDPTEEDALIANATVPGTIGSDAAHTDLAHLIPLIIQDKTFVPDNGVDGGQLAATDPTWDVAKFGGLGNLWMPHVWMPNQNPADIMGANAYGRWDYGPWFWPAQDPSTFVPQGQPYPCTSSFYGAGGPAYPPLMCPGIPNPSGAMEAMMDTPVINGTAYPTLTIDPTAYRFQVLNAANDRAWNLGFYVADPLSIGLTNGGSGYTVAPLVSIVPQAGTTDPTDAAATTTISNGNVVSVDLTNVGKGYTTAPLVTITGAGTGAVASATVDPITGTILSVKVTSQGSGYAQATTTVTIAAPSGCTIDGTTCIQALAGVTILDPGIVTSITVTNPGTGTWTAAPTVTIATGGTTQATAVAAINSDVKMVDAVPHTPTSTLPSCAVANDLSGANLVLGLTDPATGRPLNETGLPANCYPSAWPTDGRDGGVPDPTMAGPAIIQIGNESGLLPNPVVIPSTPVGYEYNRKSITVLNVFNHGLFMGPAERADLVVDFKQYAGKTLILYNDAPAPVPAFDPRNDYYTGDPDNTMSGGAPTTMPGYGPNTRTILQIKVNAASATTDNFNLTTLQAQLPGIYAVSQDKMIVPEPGFPAANGGAASGTYARIQDTSITGYFGGGVGSLTWTAGAGYTSAPTITISAPNAANGTQATVGVSFTPGKVASVTVAPNGSGYKSAPSVSFAVPPCTINGTTCIRATGNAVISSGVTALNLTRGGSGYTTVPAVTISAPPGNGVQAVATAKLTNGAVSGFTITNPGSGYAVTPSVSIAPPPGTGVRATANATVSGIVTNVLITNGGAGYTSAPAVTLTPTNGGSGAVATAIYQAPAIANIALTNSGSGYSAAPTVTITGGGTPTTAATVTLAPPSNPFQPKAIQELFTLDYGRMNATLGVEVPFTNFFTQTTIPYGYIDPPTEMFQVGDTQFWKITHNGVDTHFIHFHLFDVQVVNRIGWDGMIKPPDANEMALKDTVRMNPLEDILVAIRPMMQKLPWSIPNSVRALDPTMPIGASNAANTPGFAQIDPTNQPAVVTNDITNFGYEYVWHCHILEHEEIDMMRTNSVAVKPEAPSNVSIARSGTGNSQRVTVTWKDNSLNESNYLIQRATSMNGPWVSFTAPALPGSGGIGTYIDTALQRHTTYYYRVVADNTVGYTQTFAAPAAGYTTLSADSAPVSPAAAITTLDVTSEGPIFSDSFETGLDQWDAAVGNVSAESKGVAGPNGGKLGMAVKLGADPAYVADSMPANEAMYAANFSFDPNGASADKPVDVFVGFDQNGQPIFGVEYQSLSATDYQLRAWVLQDGSPVYTDWVKYTFDEAEDAVQAAHRIDVSWQSGKNAAFTLGIDGGSVSMLVGDTSASQMTAAVLGPTLGVSSANTGTMYFDEFTSSRVSGTTPLFIPFISR